MTHQPRRKKHKEGERCLQNYTAEEREEIELSLTFWASLMCHINVIY
jgi:hypothetical protein